MSNNKTYITECQRYCKIMKITFLQVAILLIGFSGMTKIALTGRRNDIFDAISPAPVVFSHGRNLRKREIAITIKLVSEYGQTKKLKLDKFFYRNQQGPHHYKLLFYNFMMMPKPIQHPKYKIFVDRFLCQQKIGSLIVDVVNVYRGSKIIRSYDCP